MAAADRRELWNRLWHMPYRYRRRRKSLASHLRRKRGLHWWLSLSREDRRILRKKTVLMRPRPCAA